MSILYMCMPVNVVFICIMSAPLIRIRTATKGYNAVTADNADNAGKDIENNF